MRSSGRKKFASYCLLSLLLSFLLLLSFTLLSCELATGGSAGRCGPGSESGNPAQGEKCGRNNGPGTETGNPFLQITVVDASGHAVPSAKVVLINLVETLDSNVQSIVLDTVALDSLGQHRFRHLSSSSYSVHAYDLFSEQVAYKKSILYSKTKNLSDTLVLSDPARLQGLVVLRDFESDLLFETKVQLSVENTYFNFLLDASKPFSLNSIPAGTYTLSFYYPHYIKHFISNLDFHSGSVTNLDTIFLQRSPYIEIARPKNFTWHVSAESLQLTWDTSYVSDFLTWRLEKWNPSFSPRSWQSIPISIQNGSNSLQWTDTSISGQVPLGLAYRLQAIDSAGNSSAWSALIQLPTKVLQYYMFSEQKLLGLPDSLSEIFIPKPKDTVTVDNSLNNKGFYIHVQHPDFHSTTSTDGFNSKNKKLLLSVYSSVDSQALFPTSKSEQPCLEGFSEIPKPLWEKFALADSIYRIPLQCRPKITSTENSNKTIELKKLPDEIFLGLNLIAQSSDSTFASALWDTLPFCGDTITFEIQSAITITGQVTRDGQWSFHSSKADGGIEVSIPGSPWLSRTQHDGRYQLVKIPRRISRLLFNTNEFEKKLLSQIVSMQTLSDTLPKQILRYYPCKGLPPPREITAKITPQTRQVELQWRNLGFSSEYLWDIERCSTQNCTDSWKNVVKGISEMRYIDSIPKFSPSQELSYRIRTREKQGQLYSQWMRINVWPE